MVLSSMKNIYSKIFCQCVSPDLSRLCVGNSEGHVIIFDVTGLTTNGDSVIRDKLQQPETVIQAHNESIYSMISTEDFCITGATGCFSGWKWKGIGKGSKPAWTIMLESDQTNFGTPEINSLAYDSSKDYCYAACGDWRIRGYDLESGKQVLCLEGHEDYVHDVVVSNNQITSCGEDGKVLLWDSRAGKEPRLKVIPHTYDQLKRPHFGKFITSLDVHNDWMVCGGGPNPGLFHLRSLALTTSLPPQDNVVNVNRFTRQGNNRGGIIIAGATPTVTICSISGDVTSEIKSSASCVYSVNIVGGNDNTLLTIGGSGRILDVCLNLNYRDHSVLIE